MDASLTGWRTRWCHRGTEDTYTFVCYCICIPSSTIDSSHVARIQKLNLSPAYVTKMASKTLILQYPSGSLVEQNSCSV